MNSSLIKRQFQAVTLLALLAVSFQNCSPMGKGFVASPSADASLVATVTTTTLPGSSTTTTIASVSGLVEGKNTTPPNDFAAKPALNVPFVDPVYGTSIARVTDASQVTDRNFPTWVRHEYSRRPAFNADSTRALMVSSNGWSRLYSVNSNGTMTFLKTLNMSGEDEPNWHPADPNIVYRFGQNGLGLKIYQYDIRNDSNTIARDLEPSFKALFPTAARAWTKAEGRPSKDGRIWCLQVEDNAFNILGIVAYNFQTSSILGSMAVNERPDHVSTSPRGNYCVPSWDTARGTRAYKTDFSSFTQLHSKSEHSDLALGKNGEELYVFTDYNSGHVAMVNMANGSRTNLFGLYGPNASGAAMHISGVAENKPGYVLIGFYACFTNYGQSSCDPSIYWFRDKLVAVELAESPKIYNLAHTHYGNSGYWGETQAVPNNDFTKVLFVSSWGSTSESDIASYLITLPANALP